MRNLPNTLIPDSGQCRAWAYYLPQFHPTAENDAFWSPGYTEWTAVRQAKQLFSGHCLPNGPHPSLGFYDLRDAEVRNKQGILARDAGLEGFLIWHYWFEGRTVLDEVPQLILREEDPEFSFAFAWANESWTGRWHGFGGNINIYQNYGGAHDIDRHVDYLLPYFASVQYLKVDGKPVFVIYKPELITDLGFFIERFTERVVEAGFDGVFWVVQTDSADSWAVPSNGRVQIDALASLRLTPSCAVNLADDLNQPCYKPISEAYSYPATISATTDWTDREDILVIPTLVPNWDSTPRLGMNGRVYIGASPSTWSSHLNMVITTLLERPKNRRIAIIKSWNEWAEGNYLEPDELHGYSWLDATRSGLCRDKQEHVHG